MWNDGPYKIHVDGRGNFVIVDSRLQLVDAVSIVLKSPPKSSLDFLCDLQQAMNTAFKEGRSSRNGLLVALVSWMKYADEKKYGIRDSIHLKNLFTHAVGMTEKVLKDDAQ